MQHIAALFFLLLFPSLSISAVLWTQTTRTVGSEAIVTNADEFVLATDNESSALMGFFAQTTTVDTMVTGVLGISVSEQSSDLFEDGLTGSGSFQTTTDVTNPTGFSDVFGRSIFNGNFDLDASTPYSIQGSLTSGGLGTTAQVLLFGPGGSIVDERATAGTTLPVSVSGTLAPGSYLVSINLSGNAQESPSQPTIEASGEWEMNFFLGSVTHVPAITTSALSVFPNPARDHATISLAAPFPGEQTLSVFDSTGRLVRSITTTSNRADWDTRDARGARVSAGVYFLRWDGATEPFTKRLTVLR